MSENKQQTNALRMKWVVSPYRKDKRTGAISPVPRCEYLKQLFSDIERCLGTGEDKHENDARSNEKVD